MISFEVDKLVKILIKTYNAVNNLNWMFKTLIHQEYMILSSSMYEKTYLKGFLEGVLEAI